MELNPEGCIHVHERQKLDSILNELVKAEMADLTQEKLELVQKQKDVEKKLKTIEEVNEKNLALQDNGVWWSTHLI